MGLKTHVLEGSQGSQRAACGRPGGPQTVRVAAFFTVPRAKRCAVCARAVKRASWPRVGDVVSIPGFDTRHVVRRVRRDEALVVVDEPNARTDYDSSPDWVNASGMEFIEPRCAVSSCERREYEDGLCVEHARESRA
jgi:hypothetical protein